MAVAELGRHEVLTEFGGSADVQRGAPSPLGAHESQGGVNFALFSRDAARVRLELFASATDRKSVRSVDLDPVCNRTGDVWHVWIKGIAPGQLYAYRLEGPNEPGGPRYDFSNLLLDPYATAIKSSPAAGVAPKCVFTCEEFDWRDDKPPRHPWSNTIIYETHVRGLTAHPSSRVRFPGTFRGLAEKIPYLKQLGVTTLELLPVQECDVRQNYWGYDPVAFFAPNGAYSSAGNSGQQTLEFKEMVRQLHAAGIEVILDIVLGHTAESDEQGPTLCWRGIVVTELILSALRYWVAEMHVDGFRLDLAAILGRDASGKLHSAPRILEQIAEDPLLRDAKLIAEWGAAGAYQVGGFSGRRWAERNPRYRDDVRRFWRGDEGMLGAFASRICGSEDLYAKSGKGPEFGINFVTAHDGFTLNDLVSFECKHNQADGAADCGGTDNNYSANYGTEGATSDPGIEAIRTRQIKNFLLTLYVSRGVPMLLGGDEFRRTQRGNNNAWCQDNETSWYDWRLLERYPEIHDFVRRVAALRCAHPVLARERFYTADEISWFAPTGTVPAWNDPHARALGCLIHDDYTALYLMFNAEDKPVSFTIPPAPASRQWRLAIDTYRNLAAVTPGRGMGPLVEHQKDFVLEPRTSAVLVAGGVTTGGCNPSIDHCAGAIGGDDPSAAYAAAMLWYQGYPDAANAPAEDVRK
jgi:isoamylase